MARRQRSRGGSVLTCFRKVRYTTEQAAQRSADKQRAKGRSLKPYWCGMCVGYHLTKG